MTDDCPHLVRAADVEAAVESASHPWNPRSKLIGTHLSQLGGLERTGVSLVRVPPGHESFAYHAHHYEEEWIYVLAGHGVAEIDEGEYEVGVGDFMAFPTDPPVAHHLRNPFDEDLVYLMGGENREFEVADFPRLNRRMVKTGERVVIYDLDAGRPMEPFEEG